MTEDRDAIKEAMSRLLAGRPIRSDGALTIVSLAEEANVKRHLLTHKHVDLKDEFYARVRAQGQVPHSELKLRVALDEAQSSAKKKAGEILSLKDEIQVLRRMVVVLDAENIQLRARVDELGAARLLRLDRARRE